MATKGLLTIASGIAAALASFLFGWGPCGPASVVGFFLFFGGGIAFLVGCTLVGAGLIRHLFRSNWAKTVDLIAILSGIIILAAGACKADLLVALAGGVLLAIGSSEYMHARFHKKNAN